MKTNYKIKPFSKILRWPIPLSRSSCGRPLVVYASATLRKQNPRENVDEELKNAKSAFLTATFPLKHEQEANLSHISYEKKYLHKLLENFFFVIKDQRTYGWEGWFWEIWRGLGRVDQVSSTWTIWHSGNHEGQVTVLIAVIGNKVFS